MSSCSLSPVIARTYLNSAALRPGAPPQATPTHPIVAITTQTFQPIGPRQKRHTLGPYAMDQNRILHRYEPVPGQAEPTLYYSQTPEDGNLAPAPRTSKGMFGPYFKNPTGKLVPVAAFAAGTPGIRYYSATDPDLDFADAPEHGHIDNGWDALKRGVHDALHNPAGWSASNLVKALGGSPQAIARAERIGDAPLGEGLAQLARLLGASPERVKNWRNLGEQMERLVPAYGTTRLLADQLAKGVLRDPNLDVEAQDAIWGLQRELGSQFVKPSASGAPLSNTLNTMAEPPPAPRGFSDLLVRRIGPDGRVNIGLLASPNTPPRFIDPPILHPLSVPSTGSWLLPTNLAALETELGITVTHPGLTLASTPVEYHQVRQKLERTMAALTIARQKITTPPWSESTRLILQSYFGTHILDLTPRMQWIRERLVSHLLLMVNIHKEYLEPGGMARVVLFDGQTGTLATTAFVVSGDTERILFLNNRFLDDDVSTLHEIAHHALLRPDYWYINPLESSHVSWVRNHARSDAIMNGKRVRAGPAAQRLIIEITGVWPPYKGWYDALMQGLDPDPVIAGAQTTAATMKLFEDDPLIRTAVALNNPDNLAYSSFVLAKP